MLSIVLCGSGHADFDLAKLSHDVCLMSIQVRREEERKGKERKGGMRVGKRREVKVLKVNDRVMVEVRYEGEKD